LAISFFVINIFSAFLVSLQNIIILLYCNW